MILWLIFWAAGMMTGFYGLSRAVVTADPMATLFMAVWLGAAGFGLVAGARKLKNLLLFGEGPPKARKGHVWNDGVEARGAGMPPPQA